MALFLTENIMRQFLLSEADDADAAKEGDEKETDPKQAPKKDAASTDNKDKADAASDTDDTDAESEEEPEEEDEDAGGASSGSGSDDDSGEEGGEAPGPAGVMQPAKKLQAIASKEGLHIEDTPHNRAFMLEKYQEVIKIYENLLEFVSTLSSKFPNDAKRVKILDFVTTKIENNLEMLNKALDDQIFVNMDITSLFALYKIYFNDATSVNKTIKLVVTYQNAK